MLPPVRAIHHRLQQLCLSSFRPCINQYSLTNSPIPQIRTTTTATPPRLLPSEEQQFKQILDEECIDKRGFVIYRTTYENHNAWADCKRILIERACNRINRSDAPELAHNLMWTFFDDAAAFEGASKEHLRRHFKNWAGTTLPQEQPRVREIARSLYLPRYRFFIQIDREAMDSVLENANVDDIDDLTTGHVNLVDAHWKSQADEVAGKRERGETVHAEEEPDLSYEPLEGCREEEVGWGKMPMSRLMLEVYDQLTADDSIWYVYYQRPPELAK